MKTCSKCKIEKPFEDFAKRKNSVDGRRGVCRDCRKSQAREYNATVESRARQKAYRDKPGRKEYMASYMSEYQKTDKSKAYRKAYREANSASIREYRDQWMADNYEYSPEWEVRKHLPHTMYLIRFTQGNRTYIKARL